MPRERKQVQPYNPDVDGANDTVLLGKKKTAKRPSQKAEEIKAPTKKAKKRKSKE